MKYVILAADYSDDYLKEEFSGENVIEILQLDKDTKDKLRMWNDNYKLIIPMEAKERMCNLDLINKLDKEGMDLLKKIEKQNQVKIKYFSEGFLKFIY